jgi:dsRNA-specific ribonuclease
MVDRIEHIFAPQYRKGRYDNSIIERNMMSQFGAIYLDQRQKMTWEEILRYYYENIEITSHPSPCPGLPKEPTPNPRIRPE